MRSRALLLSVVFFALPFMTAALVASADEGSPAAPAGASPPVRPPLGVLRHVDGARASVVPSAQQSARPELVVLVGGYQSCACPDDGTFDALRARLAGAGGLTVVRFGADPRFPYDTYGPVDTSAANLRDEIRSVSGSFSGVHIVTHSLGVRDTEREQARQPFPNDGVEAGGGDVDPLGDVHVARRDRDRSSRRDQRFGEAREGSEPPFRQRAWSCRHRSRPPT